VWSVQGGPRSLDGIGIQWGRSPAELGAEGLKGAPRAQPRGRRGKLTRGRVHGDRGPGGADFCLHCGNVGLGGHKFLHAAVAEVQKPHQRGSRAFRAFHEQRVELHLEVGLLAITGTGRLARLVVDDPERTVGSPIDPVDDPANGGPPVER